MYKEYVILTVERESSTSAKESIEMHNGKWKLIPALMKSVPISVLPGCIVEVEHSSAILK